MKDAQVGFNTNVSYQGQTLHIQTEDSGRGHPHVITHLYVGGTILATKRTSYEDCCDGEDSPNRVRALMKAQHKAMILELRDGVHDAAIRRMLETGAGVEDADSVLLTDEVTDRDSLPPPPTEPSAIPIDEVARDAAPPPSPAAVALVRPAPTPVPLGLRGSYRPPAPAPGEPDVVPFAGEDSPTGAAPARARGRRPGIRPAVDREREGFGKDLITDRSLDEVVLSYLADELTKDEK
jgi:hypothetical protein